MIAPIEYLDHLMECADEIAEQISEANKKEHDLVFVAYYADLVGNLYRRKTYSQDESKTTMGLWSIAPKSYIIWCGWSSEVDLDEIQDEIESTIEDDWDELENALAPKN